MVTGIKSRRVLRYFVRLAAVLGVGMLLVACGRKEELETGAGGGAALPQPPPEVALEMEAQFVAPANPKGDTIQERLQGAVHPQMTELLHKFEQKYGRLPEDWYEFSNRMMDSVPAAPPGMRYEIDPADKSVKVVLK